MRDRPTICVAHRFVAHYCHAYALELQEEDADFDGRQDETNAVSQNNVLEEYIIDVSV